MERKVYAWSPSNAMTVADLDGRSKTLLKALIKLHITSGEPVGSESLSRVIRRSLSPATIRSILAELERLGYLEHPHTSAGRRPTDEGYRLYVDTLMPRQGLSEQDAAAIDSALKALDPSPEHVMESASHLLSRLSRGVGFALTPDMGKASFRHVDLVRLPHPRILVVMVSRSGLVTSKVIELEEELSQDHLQACANYLNEHFTGMSLADIRGCLLLLMKEEKALYDSLLKRVISVARQAFMTDAEGVSVYLDGTSNMLAAADFDDLSRMQALFRTFEEKSRLIKILNACLTGGGLRILIGRENPDPDLRDLTLVTASYPLEGEGSWGLGVMGSTRMEYPRVIALVDHVAQRVSRALSELAS